MTQMLVLGCLDDPHVARVTQELTKRSVHSLVFDYLKPTQFEFRSDANGDYALLVNRTPLETPAIVWDRLKLFPGAHFFSGDTRSGDFRAKEWHAFYRLVKALFPGRIVNSIESRQCLIKPFQQINAAKCGLLTPPTTVSNNKPAIVNFFADVEAVVLKSLSAGKVLPKESEADTPYNVFTMAVEPDDIRRTSAEQFGLAPQFFQRRIPKAYELRVVVVGRQAFSFRIDSQRRESSKVDWRGASVYGLSFHPEPLDDDVRCKLLSFMDRLGLFTGSFDLIVDKNDNVWFLECNQDGQWAWLDDLVDGEITSAFADSFAARAMRIPRASKLCGTY